MAFMVYIIGWGLATWLWYDRQTTAAAATYALAGILSVALTGTPGGPRR